MFELVELAGYLVGFWLFLFSPKFRARIVRDFSSGGAFKRALIILEGISSTFVSVILPALFIYYAIFE